MKPGKPVAFGVRGDTLVFGLPGNPVSSLVGFELFVRPAVLALQGARDPLPAYAVGRARVAACAGALAGTSSSAPRCGRASPTPLAGQESHMIVRAARANALVHVPRGEGTIEAGARVRFLPLG